MPNKNLVEIDPEKLGGTPVFYGTRVPIQNLFDCLEGGESLDQFLDQFPTVTHKQALAVLEESKERLLISRTRNSAALINWHHRLLAISNIRLPNMRRE